MRNSPGIVTQLCFLSIVLLAPTLLSGCGYTIPANGRPAYVPVAANPSAGGPLPKIDASRLRQDYPIPSSPEILLENYARAYRYRDFQEFTKLFDPEEYVGYPDQASVAKEHAKSWNFETESQAARAILNAPYTIELSFRYEDPVRPQRSENVPSEWMKIVVYLEEFSVAVPADDSNDLDIYRAQGDEQVFYLKLTEERTETGRRPVWKIVEWHDVPLVPRKLGEEPSEVEGRGRFYDATMSAIKAKFLHSESGAEIRSAG